MSKCSKCGAKANPDARMCHACGAILPGDPMPGAPAGGGWLRGKKLLLAGIAFLALGSIRYFLPTQTKVVPAKTARTWQQRQPLASSVFSSPKVKGYWQIGFFDGALASETDQDGMVVGTWTEWEAASCRDRRVAAQAVIDEWRMANRHGQPDLDKSTVTFTSRTSEVVARTVNGKAVLEDPACAKGK